MSGAPPGHAVDATGARATPERRQSVGHRACVALHTILRNGRMHGPDNAVFDVPCRQLRDDIAELIVSDSEFELAFRQGRAYVNRQALQVDAVSAALQCFVREKLAARGLAGIHALRVPEPEDLRQLIALLMLPTRLPGPGAQTAGALNLIALDEHRTSFSSAAQRDDDARLVELYSQTVALVDRCFLELRSGSKPIPILASNRLAQRLIDAQQQSPMRFLQLARTKAGGPAYWGYHAANVAVLAISFGARLGLSKRRRHDLAMAALFHDLGMAAVPPTLLYKLEELTKAEQNAIRSTPLLTARTLLRDRDVRGSARERAVGAYECHLDLAGEDAAPVGPLGRVLAQCETYDALTTTQPQRPAHPHEAALALMRTELAPRFDGPLLELFAAFVDESFAS